MGLFGGGSIDRIFLIVVSFCVIFLSLVWCRVCSFLVCVVWVKLVRFMLVWICLCSCEFNGSNLYSLMWLRNLVCWYFR